MANKDYSDDTVTYNDANITYNGETHIVLKRKNPFKIIYHD